MIIFQSTRTEEAIKALASNRKQYLQAVYLDTTKHAVVLHTRYWEVFKPHHPKKLNKASDQQAYRAALTIWVRTVRGSAIILSWKCGYPRLLVRNSSKMLTDNSGEPFDVEHTLDYISRQIPTADDDDAFPLREEKTLALTHAALVERFIAAIKEVRPEVDVAWFSASVTAGITRILFPCLSTVASADKTFKGNFRISGYILNEMRHAIDTDALIRAMLPVSGLGLSVKALRLHVEHHLVTNNTNPLALAKAADGLVPPAVILKFLQEAKPFIGRMTWKTGLCLRRLFKLCTPASVKSLLMSPAANTFSTVLKFLGAYPELRVGSNVKTWRDVFEGMRTQVQALDLIELNALFKQSYLARGLSKKKALTQARRDVLDALDGDLDIAAIVDEGRRARIAAWRLLDVG